MREGENVRIVDVNNVLENEQNVDEELNDLNFDDLDFDDTDWD